MPNSGEPGPSSPTNRGGEYMERIATRFDTRASCVELIGLFQRGQTIHVEHAALLRGV
jgi:hypothetical protein